jgi:putative ABC transport system substrate-binding protein
LTAGGLCALPAVALVALPLACVAQPAAKVARIGFLRRTLREPADNEALRQSLRELGYRDGQNLAIDERHADGDATRLAALARELIRGKAHVVVVDTRATMLAVRDAMGATPTVVA